MSDTPRTDKACGWPVGHHGRIDSSDLKLSPDGPFVHSSVARELERENAALRTVLKRWLKVADDCHQEQQQVGYSEYNITVGLVCDTRALLDAARKEAQP